MKKYTFTGCMKRICLLFTVATLCISYAKGDQKSNSYPELGVTLGAIPHLSMGYWWERKGVRVSGMYLNKKRNEFHLNLGYAHVETKRVQRSINVLTSWVVGSDPGADYEYAATGIAYGINYKGFFLELGLGIPWKDDIGNLEGDLVIPIGYLGYIHRFGPIP